MAETIVGLTRAFVLTKGFTQVGAHAALIGDDDSKRLFAEIFADPDRPEVRPQEAYQATLSSIQPGWTLRLVQVFWPDPAPRVAFREQVKSWKIPRVEGMDILHQGLTLATQEYPLPFVRRTILEFVLPGNEGLAWWEGLTGLCAGFGLRVSYLDQAGIEALTRWILNPSLEYQDA
ncbi:MAG: hypothetical protein HY867_08895 [Chloroflexi bacterium]|nr:hypothetical protein [Chloroflexota bacterium]